MSSRKRHPIINFLELKVKRMKALSVTFCICFSSGVHAQTQPQLPTYDAGALMRQAEQSFQQNQMQRNLQKRDALPLEMVLNEATAIPVERFRFQGNKLLSDEQLQRVAAPYANKTLNQIDLNHLTQAISEAYRQTGWLVQAYIPRQKTDERELIVQIIESIPPNRPVK
jgi:hemolysin activation/secretion protein